jgi:cation:H+ antiporter
MTPVYLISGALLLWLGGEVLVRSAGRLARAWGMSPLVVGLTVVAFGTSSPELAATLVASFRGSPEVALGTVVGSNIANLGLILGLTALVAPVFTRARFLRRGCRS